MDFLIPEGEAWDPFLEQQGAVCIAGTSNTLTHDDDDDGDDGDDDDRDGDGDGDDGDNGGDYEEADNHDDDDAEEEDDNHDDDAEEEVTITMMMKARSNCFHCGKHQPTRTRSRQNTAAA